MTTELIFMLSEFFVILCCYW